jgi:hypothetical protein
MNSRAEGQGWVDVMLVGGTIDTSTCFERTRGIPGYLHEGRLLVVFIAYRLAADC